MPYSLYIPPKYHQYELHFSPNCGGGTPPYQTSPLRRLRLRDTGLRPVYINLAPPPLTHNTESATAQQSPPPRRRDYYVTSEHEVCDPVTWASLVGPSRQSHINDCQ